MIAIINATLVMRDHYIPEGILLMEDGKIVDFGEMRLLPTPEGAEIIDAKGAYVGPGLIDIHVHAGAQVEFVDDPVKAATHHLKQGTTTLFPAMYFNMNAKQYVETINRVKAIMGTPGCENVQGLYMEGPYLNPKFGADRESNPWRGPIDKEDYLPIIEAAYDVAKVWALAPERENILDFVLAVREKNPAAVFSVAHSEASPYDIEALMPYGLKVATHHTNATGDRPMYPECRGVCVDEAVNYNREIYAELICDSRGIHVDPYMLRLVRRIKGDDRIMLISDACAFDGPVPEGYEGVNDILFDFAGEIAGSKLTLNVACRNMMKHTGASIVNVFNYASYTPSRVVGMTDRGEIARGKRADLIICDYMMNVSRVIIAGKTMVEN